MREKNNKYLRGVSGLSASQEEYLSAIWSLVQEKGTARVSDISRLLGVKNPSVTTALKTLAELDLVNYSPYDSASLRPKGEALARSLAGNRKALHDFMVKVLSLDSATALENARHMVHILEPEVIHRLTKFIEYYETCPGDKVRWVEGRGYFCEGMRAECESCMHLHQT